MTQDAQGQMTATHGVSLEDCCHKWAVVWVQEPGEGEETTGAETDAVAAINPAPTRKIIAFFIGLPLETFVLAKKGYRACALDGYTSGRRTPDY